VLLVQRNITERAQLENSLSELTEAQLAMMSQVGGKGFLYACELYSGQPSPPKKGGNHAFS